MRRLTASWAAMIDLALREVVIDSADFRSVDSTDRRKTAFKILGWGFILRGLSGSFVELPRDCAEFGLAIVRHIDAAREVSAQEPVGVLVATALGGKPRGKCPDRCLSADDTDIPATPVE